MKFQLDAIQHMNLLKWQEDLRNKYNCWGHYSYIFSPTSLGMNIIVKRVETGEEIDLSDYENW